MRRLSFRHPSRPMRWCCNPAPGRALERPPSSCGRTSPPERLRSEPLRRQIALPSGNRPGSVKARPALSAGADVAGEGPSRHGDRQTLLASGFVTIPHPGPAAGMGRVHRRRSLGPVPLPTAATSPALDAAGPGGIPSRPSAAVGTATRSSALPGSFRSMLTPNFAGTVPALAEWALVKQLGGG